MNKIVKIRQHPIPQKKYEEAFKKHFKCKEDDYEIKPLYDDGPMIVKFKSQFFRVDSAFDMYKNGEAYLTDIVEASVLPVSIWVSITLIEEIHLNKDFYINLIADLSEKTDFEKLNLALNISNLLSHSGEAFWESIYALGEYDLYPKAIIAAAKTCDLDELTNELLENLILYGDQIFPELLEGIFETVDLQPDGETEDDLFYIYTVEEAHWTILKN